MSRSLRLGALCLLTASLTACGAPISESRRPKADDGSCARIDGAERCSDTLTSTKNPAEKGPFSY